jgi:hypothetical protein
MMALIALLPTVAAAQTSLQPGVLGISLRRAANGALGILAYNSIPDTSASSLSINRKDQGDPGLDLLQFGVGFTVSESFPLYLEGFAGGSRYDPRFVFSDGQQEREVPTRWNSGAATVGIGWDFRISEHWVIRPIANASLGTVRSDASLAGSLINHRTDVDLEFLQRGKLNAYGLGGSLMLDYEYASPLVELDLELRWTQLHLTAFDSSRAVRGSADAATANIWGRVRWPTGLEMFGSPLRYVIDGSLSSFFMDQRNALGFNQLMKIGAGMEFDISRSGIPGQRVRIMARYLFGDHVSGASMGFAISF